MTVLRSFWHGLRSAYGPQSPYSTTRRPHPATCDSTLPGRQQLIERLGLIPGSHVVEFCTDSGNMMDVWGAQLGSLASLELVEPRSDILPQAYRRSSAHSNVRVVQASIGAYHSPAPADCVYFSYSLSHAPDWVRALDNALAALKPGGTLGIVDFYLPDAQATMTRERHGTISRWFWMQWFEHFDLHVSKAHVPALFALTDHGNIQEGLGVFPGMPALRVPYYVFTGIKPARVRAEVINDLWKKSAQQQ